MGHRFSKYRTKGSYHRIWLFRWTFLIEWPTVVVATCFDSSSSSSSRLDFFFLLLFNGIFSDVWHFWSIFRWAPLQNSGMKPQGNGTASSSTTLSSIGFHFGTDFQKSTSEFDGKINLKLRIDWFWASAWREIRISAVHATNLGWSISVRSFADAIRSIFWYLIISKRF